MVAWPQKCATAYILRFCKIGGGGNEDLSILGSILGSPDLGTLPDGVSDRSKFVAAMQIARKVADQIQTSLNGWYD